MTFVKGVVYDPQRAKESVMQTKDTLMQLEETLKADDIPKEKTEEVFKQYQQLPITFQINWAVAGEDANENQKRADFCRDRLIELNHQHHFTQNKIPRAFNADNY
ncbi:hypothetical protein SAMD00019534_079270 [Acytostelium subglobosum LB1]|uniref:hypothetical protein n=1 Tax=Acytostelium subglobosum LB1 TaxID=1410327 RepID=UPI000644DBDB|nr:hypothetical protein SAMD00019534_079270 [Acytostelium subglobosum LB1]GAM24752.1 hypothetical protein SAMD00019534_079270 [Acytostelium subglobosum LB1]|eukprot:XP_012752421.1 hypothetical protein SAMD00019534_079270 [Acytostelium subglobosum LB1]